MERLLLLKLLCDTIIIVFGVIAICDIIYRLKQQSTSKKCKTYHVENKEVHANFINVEDLSKD